MTPEKILQLSKNLLSGSYTNDLSIRCLQGLLIDDTDVRERIIQLMLGLAPCYNRNINIGDTVYIPKSAYFFQNEYDLDKTIDAGYAKPPKDSTYYYGDLICEVIDLRSYQKINTFDLKTKVWTLKDDKLIDITFSENYSTPQLIVDYSYHGQNK